MNDAETGCDHLAGWSRSAAAGRSRHCGHQGPLRDPDHHVHASINQRSWDLVARSVPMPDQAGQTAEAELVAGVIDLVGAVDDRRLLDVGCGHGAISTALAAQGARVTAVDFSHEQLSMARRFAEARRAVTWVQCDATRLPASLEDGSFDLAVSVFGAFQYAPVRPLLDQLHRVLAPGGLLAIWVRHPNLDSIDPEAVGQQYEQKMFNLPSGETVALWLYGCSVHQWRRELELAGYRLVKVRELPAVPVGAAQTLAILASRDAS